MSEEIGQFFINPIISTSSDFKKLLELEDSYPNQHSSGVIEEDPVTGEIKRDIYQEDYSREEFTKGSRFLFGKPGSGKTKLLAKLEKLYSSEDPTQTDKRVVQHNQKVQLIKLKESYQNNSTENNLTQRVAADASLLLLDGLDEMKEQFIYKFLEDVNNLTINRAELSIIISSRTYLLERYPELKSLRSFKYSVISPFDRKLQKEFIEKTNLELDQKESLKNYLWRHKTPLYFNPRYLSILCFLVQKRIIGGSEIENLSRYDIFEKLTKFALEREIEEKSQPEIYLNVLQKLATVISIKGDTEIHSEDLIDFFDYAQFDSKAVVLNKDSLKTLYDKCLLKKRIDYIEFDYREIQEFLTAKELIKISKHLSLFTKLCFTENPICFKSHWLNSINFFIEKKPETFLQFLKYCHRLDDISQINTTFHSVFEYLDIERLSRKDKDEIFTIIFEFYQKKTMWTLGSYWELRNKLFTLYNHENEKHKELVFQYILDSFKSNSSFSNTEKYNYIGLTNAFSVIQASFDQLSENEKNILKGLLIKDINIALNHENDGQILLQKRLELLGKYKDKKIFTNENIKSLFETRQLETAQEQAKKKSHIPLEDMSLKRLLELGYELDEENDLFFNLLMRNHNSKYTHESNSNTVIFQMDYLTEKVNSKKNIKKILDKISLESYEEECFICDFYFNLGEKQCRSFSEKIYQLLKPKEVDKPKEVEEYLRRLLYSEKSRSSWICDLKNHLLERVLEENRNWLDEEILLLHSSQEDSKNKLELLLNIFNTERINLVLDKLNSNSIKVILEIFKDDINYLSRLIEFLIKSNNPNKENIAKEISSKAGLSVQKNKNMSETLITGNRAAIAKKHHNKNPQITENQNDDNKIRQSSLADLIEKYLNSSYKLDEDLYKKAIQERYPSLTEDLETEIKKQSKQLHKDLSTNSGNPVDLYFKINYLINIYDSESLRKFLQGLILEYFKGLEYYTSIISDLDISLKDEKFLTDLLKKLSKVPENNRTKSNIINLKISRYADLKLAKERLKDILKNNAMHSMEEHREALSNFLDQELFFGKDKVFKKILKLCKNNLEQSPSEYGRMSLLFSILCNNLKILSAKPELKDDSQKLLNELESEFKKLGSFPNKNFLELTLSELRAYFTNSAKPSSMLEASLHYNSLRDSILTDIPDAFTLKEKVLKILRKDDNGFLKTILEKIKIKPETNQQATKKNESSQSTNSSSQNEKSQRKPAREKDIQNELKLLIENRFLREGLTVIITREAETDIGKKADYLISYGFVNPILIELKYSDHGDLKSENSSKKIEETDSYTNFLHYKNNFHCEYGIFLILDNEEHKRDTWRSKLKKVKKAYEKNSNVEVISLSQRFQDSN